MGWENSYDTKIIMLYTLQFSRAVAALLVVLFHASGNLAKDKYFGENANYLSEIFKFGGDAGVAFFFVLSGFIIHHIHKKDWDNPNRIWPYIRKRVTRIYPTYIIIFVGVWALAKLTPSLQDTVPSDLWLLIKSILLIPQDKNTVGGTGAPVLIVAWSLQYEIFFYAVFISAIIHRWIFYTLSILIVANIFLVPLFGPYEFPRSFASNHLIILFGMGMTASIALEKIRASSFAPRMIASTILALLVTALFANMQDTEKNKIAIDLTYGILSALLIFSLALNELHTRSSFGLKKFTSLGDASYNLYLIHFPLIAILSKVCIKIFPANEFWAGISLIFMVATSILVSMIFYKFIEKPMLRRLSA